MTTLFGAEGIAMRRICVWCRAELADAPNLAEDDELRTICRDCWNNVRFQRGAALHEYLEALDVPVVLVNRLGVIEDANGAACRRLEKTPPAVYGKTSGEVFECKYARLPGGCGNTIHCSGCTIRRAVLDTFETGRPHARVPATLRSRSTGLPEPVALFITTHKANEMVLLLIEDADRAA